MIVLVHGEVGLAAKVPESLQKSHTPLSSPDPGRLYLNISFHTSFDYQGNSAYQLVASKLDEQLKVCDADNLQVEPSAALSNPLGIIVPQVVLV